MSFARDLDRALAAVQKEFPIENYVSQRTRREAEHILRAAGRFMDGFQGKRLLDIGSGPMDKTAVFQKMGFECHAVDDLKDPWHRRGENVAEIQEFARRMGIVFHLQDLGDYSVPFPRNSFDLVCSIGVIEHLHESPRGLLNTMGEFARPGGLVVVVSPNAVNLRKRLSVLTGRTNYPPIEGFYRSPGAWRGHVREYTLAELGYVCRQNGFEVLLSTTYEIVAGEKLRPPLRQVYSWLGDLWPKTRSHLMVVCRKPRGWSPAKQAPEAFRKAMAGRVPSAVA